MIHEAQRSKQARNVMTKAVIHKEQQGKQLQKSKHERARKQQAIAIALTPLQMDLRRLA